MRVDNHLAHAKEAQAAEDNLKQRAAGDGNQCLGPVVGERLQARAQAGGQNHRLHRPIFSNSICRTITSTPLARRCFTNSSARYTERCWPPVQPNETIRFLKPRR